MATPILAGTTNGAASLDLPRIDLARDALAEIRAISQLLRRVMASEPEELTVELLGRGMLARVQSLADAAADALDPNGQPAAIITELVTCRAGA